MNKHRPYTRIGKTLNRLGRRNATWNIPKPTSDLDHAILLPSKNRLARTGKNLAKKGAVRSATK